MPGTWSRHAFQRGLCRFTGGVRRRTVLFALLLTAGILLAPPVVLEGWALLLPLPETLVPNNPGVVNTAPTVVRDRGGQVLALLRADGKLSQDVRYDDLPRHVVDALLAAEDKRFWQHGGVDWIAIARASYQALTARRIVSGASTLTQQLARSTFKRERTLWGKLREMALATRIERTLTKAQIIEAYVNRVEFGPNIVGIGAAASSYFAKPVHSLSLSEAATLVGLPRGPAVYNPERRPDRAKRRRDRVLTRLANNNPQYAEAVSQALLLPLELQDGWIAPGGFHWVRRLAKERSGASTLQTTLDSSLQSRVETLLRTQASTFSKYGATSAAVLIAHNGSGDVLAYVGSPDYFSQAIAGQNDGITAPRQPGSTLKPFVYASAMQHLGYTAATVLPDVPLEFRERGHVYSPRNYDGRFHGPVRLREALGNSLNVPAVHTASQIGVARLLGDLRTFGFASLTQPPEHYGVALALGDGEVTLEELVAAYMMLANGGERRTLRFTLDAQSERQRVMTRPTAALMRDILQDPRARAASFGRHGALEFTYPVAVKTGTSKGARDNWTLGFSDQLTLGVWVGNFDDTPMVAASGASVAGPLFHALMNEATEWVKANYNEPTSTSAASAEAATVGLRRVAVCELSGMLPNSSCPSHLLEWFIPGTEPQQVDTFHVRIDVKDGALAPGCPGATRQLFENYPAPYVSWAKEVGRPLLPTETWINCTHKETIRPEETRPTVVFPRAFAVYRVVADEPMARQQLVLRAKATASSLTFLIDGVPYRRVNAPFEVEWPLTLGNHTVQVVTPDGQKSERVEFRVE